MIEILKNNKVTFEVKEGEIPEGMLDDLPYRTDFKGRLRLWQIIFEDANRFRGPLSLSLFPRMLGNKLLNLLPYLFS